MKYAHNKLKVKLKYAYALYNLYNLHCKRTWINKWKAFSLKKDYDLIFDKINESNHYNNHHTGKYNKKFNINNNNNATRLKSASPLKNINLHNNTTSTTTNNNNQYDTFLNRQEKFSQRVKQKKQMNTNKIEEELHLLYTFSPKVNTRPLHSYNISTNTNNYVDRNIPSSNNLHTASNNIRSNIERCVSPTVSKKQSSFDRLYRNSSAKMKQKNLSSKASNKSFNVKKAVHSKAKIDKLHKDYKTYENKKKDLQKKIDEDMGITFKPKSFTANSGYVVDSNFEERNKKLIEDRNNFVFVYDYLRQCKFNEHVLGGSNSNKLLKEYIVKNNVEIENLMQKQSQANQMLVNEEENEYNNENGAVFEEERMNGEDEQRD